jgi:RNase adapter protein RapZ
MPRKIYSFGSKYNDPPPSTALVIDVRKWMTRNPFWNKKLRHLRGTDAAVQEDIRQTPNFKESLTKICDFIGEFAGDVYIGCTGGHHRSVYIAEVLGVFYNCPVEHRDIHKE